MRYIRVGAVIAGVLLAGCSGAPDGTTPYIGTWKSEHASLTVTRTGRMTYHRDSSEIRVEEGFFNVPIKRASSTEIVGTLADARVEIGEPPHEAGGSWQMTVNGDVLTKE